MHPRLARIRAFFARKTWPSHSQGSRIHMCVGTGLRPAAQESASSAMLLLTADSSSWLALEGAQRSSCAVSTKGKQSLSRGPSFYIRGLERSKDYAPHCWRRCQRSVSGLFTSLANVSMLVARHNCMPVARNNHVAPANMSLQLQTR